MAGSTEIVSSRDNRTGLMNIQMHYTVTAYTRPAQVQVIWDPSTEGGKLIWSPPLVTKGNSVFFNGVSWIYQSPFRSVHIPFVNTKGIQWDLVGGGLQFALF